MSWLEKREWRTEALVRASGGMGAAVVNRIYATALEVIEKEWPQLRDAAWTEDVKCKGCGGVVRCAVPPDRIARAMAATAQGLDAVGGWRWWRVGRRIRGRSR